jgi:hypothetical protein
MKNSGIKVVITLQEAMDIVEKEKGTRLLTYFMPSGSSTLPRLSNRK